MEKAERYRDRAQGLRDITRDMPESNVKRMLLSLAREYDRLARLSETAALPDDSLDALAAMKKHDQSN